MSELDEEDLRYADLLERRIAESGLSDRQFAMQVLLKGERTVRRWLAREAPISNLVREFLDDPKPRPWPTDD